MNYGTLRHLWPRFRGSSATATTRCLSSSARCSKFFLPQQAMRAARQQNQKQKQKQQYQDGDTGLESLSSGSQGNLNLGLSAWAREHGIDIDVGKKMKPSREKEGARETGVYVHYSLARHPSEYHMKDLVLTTPLTVKYMADYEHRTKHPLWLVQHASFNHPNIIRTTAMKKARRALLAALKRNHYLPNGKAFADDLVRGTELYGTIKIFVNEPLKTVNTPMAKLASYFNNLLKKDILVAMRRRVIKKLRPDRASPASGPPRVVKPVSSANRRAIPRGLGYAQLGDSLGL